jgi:hypothetical protein
LEERHELENDILQKHKCNYCTSIRCLLPNSERYAKVYDAAKDATSRNGCPAQEIKLVEKNKTAIPERMAVNKIGFLTLVLASRI